MKEEACPGWNDRVCRTGSQVEGNDCSCVCGWGLGVTRMGGHVLRREGWYKVLSGMSEMENKPDLSLR